MTMTGMLSELSRSQALDVQPWVFTFTLINPSLEQDIFISNFQTPFDTLTACRSFDLYDITFSTIDENSFSLPHTGALYKRHINDTLQGGKQIKISTNSKYQVDIDLSECYEFKLNHIYSASLKLSNSKSFPLSPPAADSQKIQEYIFTATQSHHPNPKV